MASEWPVSKRMRMMPPTMMRYQPKALKPFHGQHGHYKGHDASHDEHRDVVRCGPVVGLAKHFYQVEQRGACHGGHSQEKRELGGTLAREPLLHAAHDGRHRAAHARDHRETLPAAYDEGSPPGHFVAVGALVEYLVDKEHEHAAQHQGRCHGGDAVEQPVEQARLLGGKAYDHGGYHAHDEQAVEPHLGGKLLLVAHLEKLLPVQAHHREDGAKLNDKRESMHKGVAWSHMQHVLCNDHVACRGDRQKFSQALDDGYDYRLK